MIDNLMYPVSKIMLSETKLSSNHIFYDRDFDISLDKEKWKTFNYDKTTLNNIIKLSKDKYQSIDIGFYAVVRYCLQKF